MTKNDKILIVLIVIISIGSLFYIKKMALNHNQKYISIQVNGKEIQRVMFDKKTEGNIIPVKTQFGYNLIKIGQDSVWIAEADCPDQICVKQGLINEVGGIIICLPHRLVVEIKSMGQKDVDHINY